MLLQQGNVLEKHRETHTFDRIDQVTMNGLFVHLHNHALIGNECRDRLGRANACIGPGREKCNYWGLTNNFMCPVKSNLVNRSGLMLLWDFKTPLVFIAVSRLSSIELRPRHLRP